MNKKQIALLVLIILIGVFFRFYLIGKAPGGLFPDEAANGMDVNNILKGHLQPFYERGNGREALFFYLEAGSVLIFGTGVWQLHIVSAAIGVLTIYSTFLLAKRLFGTNTALLAAFLIAVSAWHALISRTAFRANLTPLFATLVFYFLVRAVQAKTIKDRNWSAVFFGIFFSGGLYTYIAYKSVPLLFFLLVILLLIADWRQNFMWAKKYWRAFVYAVIAGIITFLPMAAYLAKNPADITGRASQVSVFNKDLNHGHLLATIGDVFYKSVRAYFIDGDTNWRQNISGQAFISPLVSPFFGIGLLIMTIIALRWLWQCLRKHPDYQAITNNLKYVIPVALFWVLLAPAVATDEGIPHGLRSLGTVSFAYIITAVAMVWFARLALRVWHPRWMEYVYALVLVIFLGTMAYMTFTAYFVYAYNDPEYFQAFRSDLTPVSAWLNANGNKSNTLLVLDTYSLQTVDYLTAQNGNPYVVVDPANSYKLHLQPGQKLVFTESTMYDFYHFADTHPKNIKVDYINRDKFGFTNMVVLESTNASGSDNLASNADHSFNIINYGDRIDFSWTNLQFNPWKIDIYQCADQSCTTKTLVKEDNQNDYFANNDYILADGTKKDLYFEAIASEPNGQVLKDFGIIKIPQYK